jgi:hypothetical protein
VEGQDNRPRGEAEDRIRDYVLKVVADAPPLTPEQQSRLRSLFQASVHVQEQAREGRGALR